MVVYLPAEDPGRERSGPAGAGVALAMRWLLAALPLALAACDSGPLPPCGPIGGAACPSDAGPANTAPLDAADAVAVVDAGLTCALPDGGAVTIDPRRDTRHCGGCNRRCCGGFCVGGRCGSDSAGLTTCGLTPAQEAARGCFGTIQADLHWDPSHCGVCHRACAAGQRCEAGRCMTPVGDAGADVP